MPKVTINDDVLDADVGDTLLSVARRNAAHIGFVCNGRGICQTCECQVHAGSENLSRASAIEADVMTPSRRERGYRLACQTEIIARGDVRVTTYVEQLRRHALQTMKPAEGTTTGENLGLLFNHLTRFGLDYISSLPYIVTKAVPRAVSNPPTMNELQQIVADTQRIFQRVMKGGKASDVSSSATAPDDTKGT